MRRVPSIPPDQRSHLVQEFFGDRVASTLDTTEIETWSQRQGTARSSRKKQVELLRAAIKRGIRDKYVEADPTDGVVVPPGSPGTTALVF